MMLATIEIAFDSADDAEQVRKAIGPDNTPIPEGIQIGTTVHGTTLCVTISCERSIDSFRFTIEDIMSAIDLSIRTQQSIE